jgi:hypothetical protein
MWSHSITHTHTHCRNPLEEGPTRRRGFSTWHHKTNCEPAIQANERPQTHALDIAVTIHWFIIRSIWRLLKSTSDYLRHTTWFLLLYVNLFNPALNMAVFTCILMFLDFCCTPQNAFNGMFQVGLPCTTGCSDILLLFVLFLSSQTGVFLQ